MGVSFYEKVFLKIRELFNKYKSNNKLKNIISVDVTYNNTNIKNDGT